MVCYSHLFRNFPEFVVNHTIKGFGIVNEAEIDAFLELSCFFNDPTDVDSLIPGSSGFSKTCLIVWGGTWEGGSGWGTHVHLWQIHINVWQNQYNIVK